MKQRCFLMVVILLVTNTLFAQELSREEKALLREWEKRKKETTPEQFKILYENKEAKEKELRKIEEAINTNEQLLAQKNTEIFRLRNQIAELEKKKSKQLEQENEDITTTLPQSSPKSKKKKQPEPEMGKYYVQLECGENVLILDVFNSMAEAEKFQKSLRKIQINNAAVVSSVKFLQEAK